MDDEETFASVAWDTPEHDKRNQAEDSASATQTSRHSDVNGGFGESPYAAIPGLSEPSPSKDAIASNAFTSSMPGISQVTAWKLDLSVSEPVKELEGSKEAYVSYLIRGETDLANFTSKQFETRRRYQDFVFLKDHLTKDFQACVVPPLPDKHRLEYIKGDRFSTEFVERRRADLERFLQRLARHPTLSRSRLLQAFLESTEWTVTMHKHLAHPPIPDSPPSLLDNISDTLVNAFTKVRKPDERFTELREQLDKFEESIDRIERLHHRMKGRTGDLSQDYADFSGSIEGLGFLESGITEPLARFASSLDEFEATLKDSHQAIYNPFMSHLQSLLAYSSAFRSVLKLRDQKQLDFEGLSAYLSNMTSERDRLASGAGPKLGISGYLKHQVDTLRGSQQDMSREARMAKLDSKIKELQEAVTAAHTTSEAFSNEVLREQSVFDRTKQIEMKIILTELAEAQIEMHKKTMDDFEKCVPFLQRINAGT
ncbi:uncharacterized protein L969DRAFT_84865 [Mixia osmundae IAM 14324]|uniref:Sorting nexin-4 n=1 Tax=Mixia osmundae (strain CBS 9802 / IAM 14324 / JCM 22182 / KY 12970) TaxID=764103 RepID=G7DXR0_MIXOS|nr:uncharacterized protein L969DRAFT_84865 [Mixia osmundae IAM 14324]KEI41143.1 hypothetical protein L969DRAFT_84865 [Mixia osmundae IAM 14324]GAA95370.1 hypothetical protein E5Q_02024 [Mixia osmundae IAM 14324]